MTTMQCRCGQRVYFNNHDCVNCGRMLVFDSNTLSMLSEDDPGSGLPVCANRATAVRCNWAPAAGNQRGF